MKKVFIVPHSHWDREWYMPYEQHHMRLVELIDNLIKLFKDDPNYKYFHLDGQTIILDDYLEVRPENRNILKSLIKQGKLQVGPFYILQDAFLTTSESNARNMLIGHIESEKWGGEPVKVGYFPDTFGNMGQTPQLMKQIGLDSAMFGRGVKPTGFANAVSDDDQFTSQYSEMNWRGPDGSKILGVLFANWYDNGKEIPVDLVAAKQYWDEKLAKAESFASTDNLLFLNGSDHEPVQMNLSKAIKVANELYPDIEFVHATYNMYLEQLKTDLPKNLDMIDGEITSQETNGWTTLANTASTRVPVKQWNTKVSKQLEMITEPLNVLATKALGCEYPHDELRYAWKMLMQNHPHDSICACSVDGVIDEMMTRFKKADEVGKFLASEALDKIGKQINTNTVQHGSRDIPFVVFNTATSKKTDVVTITVPIKKIRFNPNKDNAQELFKRLENESVPHFIIKDSQNKIVAGVVKDIQVKFNYSLPKDEFRHAYIEKIALVEMALVDIAPTSWQVYRLVDEVELPEESGTLVRNSRLLENKYLKVNINVNGTLTVEDKVTGNQYPDLLTFEDTGDVGNEYVYKQSADMKTLYSTGFDNQVKIIENTSFRGVIELINYMEIPKEMDNQLLIEQMQRVDYRSREAKRSKNKQILEIRTQIILNKDDRQLRFKTKLDNQMKDHRIRVNFKTGMKTNTHYADSIYEVVKRSNKVSDKWLNPENPQHTHAFVNVQNNYEGMTISNIGLNEYEVAQDGSEIYVTLLRSVGEMGDWGYFATPGAQCLGELSTDYALELHDSSEENFLKSVHNAFAFQTPFTATGLTWHAGKLKPNDCIVENLSTKTKVTALKNAEDGNDIIVRQYNLTDREIVINNEIMKGGHYQSSLIEECGKKEHQEIALKSNEIYSTRWRVN